MNDTATTRRVSARPFTVLIADEHALVRDALKMIAGNVLANAHFLEAHDAESLMRELHLHRDIRLALIDPGMPGMHGGLRLHQIARHHPRLPLVIISAVTSPNVVRRIAAMPSVHAFVSKCSCADDVRMAIETTLQGKRMPAVISSGAIQQRHSGLTPRQQEIRKLLSQRLSNKVIARTLGLSTGTVKNHITEIFKILNISNRTQAAQLDADT